MPRFIPGIGVPLNAEVVSAALAANAPALNTATFETYTGTVAAGGIGSTVSLILNGVTYTQEYDTSNANSADLLATACGSGTFDKWSSAVSGGNAVGTETITLTIPGDTGGNIGTGVWTYNPAAGRTNAQMGGDLRTLIGTTFPSSLYNVGGGGAGVSLTKKTRGVGVTPAWTADGALAVSLTNTVVGVAGQADWNVSALAAVLTVAHATAGVTADTVSSAVTGTFTLTMTESIVGYDVLPETAGTTMAFCRSGTGTVRAILNAGTSYNLEIYTYVAGSGWSKDLTFGTKTVNASGTYNWNPSGIQAYAQVSNFVGGASATVTLETPS